MPDGSFKKLAVPPRLNDQLLEPLSPADHAKYLFFHARYRRILETIQRQGSTSAAIEQFGLSADWLRVVDHLMRRWSKPWAYAYIHHTYPAFNWPGRPKQETIDPLTFAFLWFHGVPDFCDFQFYVSHEFACPFCGRLVQWPDMVFRFGTPSCGCGKRILQPTLAHVMVSDDFDKKDLVEAFRLRCREQRVLDTVDYSGPVYSGMVFAFMGRRAGSAEEELQIVADRGLPVFILGKRGYDASASASRGPVVGGVTI